MRTVQGLLSLLLVVALVGCAEERAPINQVQANALPKSFFVGERLNPDDDPEFYFRVTVVDAQAGAGNDGLFTSSDAQPTTRVRWEISEDLLIARLTYELIDGTDGRGVSRAPNGQVVAAYTIDTHFDVRRQYNESTGEELNVIIENDTDRPWYERDYMRVDWSRNLVTSAYELDTLAQLGIYYGVNWEPVSYYVSDANHEDAPVFDVDNGYFDVTNRAWATPEVIEDEWWGDFPACWLTGYYPVTSCNSSEVTLRQSFKRVTDTDYEPLHYDGARMDMFGLFTADRFGYDRGYGVVDDKWRRFATRWNIWNRSHAEPTVPCNTAESTPVGADPHRDEDGDGTEDECADVGRGSRCDDVVGECTIPLRDRTVRTIPWHVNPTFDPFYWEGTERQLKVWSDAVRVAVVAGRLAECRRTGGTDCESEFDWPTPWTDDWAPPVGTGADEVPEIFVMCHNPVDPNQGDDVSVCGPAGTVARLGDLRFNFLNIINEFQATMPWGIMMDADDPLTGEHIAGSVNVWAASTDRHAASLVDLIQVLNGAIAPDEYIDGQDISDWIAANQLSGAAERGTAMAKEEITRRRKAFDQDIIAKHLGGLPAEKKGAHPHVRRKMRTEALIDGGRLGPGNAVLSERLRRLQGTEVEAMMVGPDMMQAAGYNPTGPVSPDAIRRGSPFGHLNPSVHRARLRQERMSRASRHSCRFEAPGVDNLLGLARQAQEMFPLADPGDAAAVAEQRNQIYDWARDRFNQGVMAHEFGHSVGLRHNFAGTFDSLNYEAGYWQLRTNHGAVTDGCPDGNEDGASCVGPRWRDPLSQDEIEGNIQRYATTSVMDYPGDQNQDMILPGKYDRAAMRFAYGGVVDVWASEGVSVNGTGAGQAEAYKLTTFAISPALDGVYYFPTTDGDYEFIHYSQYQNEFGLISNCTDSSDEDAVGGKKCTERPLDVVDYRDLSDWIDNQDYSAFDWAYTSKAIDPEGRVRRGYMFSSDEYADAGNVPSFTGDFGADAYEIVAFLEGQYENRYILDSFRRNNVTFNSMDASWRIQARYLDNIQQIGKTFAFGVLIDGDPTAPDEALLVDGFYGPLEMAATVAFDMFARMMTRPEPGYYCEVYYCTGKDVPGVYSYIHIADPVPIFDPEFEPYDFRVALGDGRYLHNDYDYSQGYWWGDYQTQVGVYYDKIWATYYLTEAFDYFISNAKEDFTDSRYKNVSFATVFPEQVRRLYNNLLTGDYDIYGPWVVPGAGEAPLSEIQYPQWSNVDGLGEFPADGLVVDPNYAFNEQIYQMVWGAMFFPTNWSNSFIHEATIVSNAGEHPIWYEDEVVEFYNPMSGRFYRARTYGTEEIFGIDVERGVGARMLAWANQMMTFAYLVELDDDGYPVFDEYGNPILLLDDDLQPQVNPDWPGADLALQGYVDQIDMMRQLVATFEQPLDYGLPEP